MDNYYCSGHQSGQSYIMRVILVRTQNRGLGQYWAQTCINFQSFRAQKLWSQDIISFGKDCMICNIIEEITKDQADLDLYEVFLQSSCKEFKLIVSTNLTVFQPLFFCNLKIFQ
jgi:hypothetical protein